MLGTSNLRRLAPVPALAALLLAPAADAKDVVANVVAMPSELAPGRPVSVLLELHHSAAGGRQPVAGVRRLEVVLAGDGDVVRRFPAADAGGGRYSAEIVFPSYGGWRLAVALEDRWSIPLGKGAVRLGRPEPDGTASASLPALLAAGLLAVGLVAAARPAQVTVCYEASAGRRARAAARKKRLPRSTSESARSTGSRNASAS